MTVVGAVTLAKPLGSLAHAAPLDADAFNLATRRARRRTHPEGNLGDTDVASSARLQLSARRGRSVLRALRINGDVAT